MKSIVNNSNFSKLLEDLSLMFYLTNPTKYSYEKVEEVPNFYSQAWPYFLVFIFVENIILFFQHQPTLRLNDGITSLSHGILQECGRMVFRGFESIAYIYVYQNFRVVDLPWDSPYTWYLAAIAIDFGYYWVHRACHEVHILWAQHQVHHSSEEYNLPVGLRQSVIQEWCGIMFYLPLAFVIPPTHFLTHHHFNLLYQFWIHTKVINTLGPLEWVFNTPNHHRVHHGCNLYCLDKNYGGFLIIWDRIFGTFQEEKKNEEIVYGLVFQQPSFNPLFLQIFYNGNVITKLRSMKDWKNKLSAIWKGPSWQPGKPRLGAEEDKLKIKNREKYDVELSCWSNIYLLIHFVIVVFIFQDLTSKYMGMSALAVAGIALYILFSLTIIGMLFDKSSIASKLELVRCLIFLFYLLSDKQYLGESNLFYVTILQIFFLLSSIIWIILMLSI